MYGQSFEVPETDEWLVPIGKGKIVKSGSDITITAFSIMVGKALKLLRSLVKKELRLR